MGTKRTPIARLHRVLITQEAVELFRIVMATKAQYRACIGETCPNKEPGRHCETCRKQIEATVALGSALNIPLWGTGPGDAENPEPPEWETYPMRRDQYRQAHELYLLLSEAAA